MARPSIPAGQTGDLRYYLRQAPGEHWRAVTLDEARRRGWTRARAGRAWRAMQSVGTPTGTRAVSRIAPTHAAAASALGVAVADMVAALTVDPGAPTWGDMLAWVRDRLAAGDDPRVKSPDSVRQYLNVLATWCGLGPVEGERTHHYRTDLPSTPVEEVTPGDLQDELARIARAGGASATRHVRALWIKAGQRAVALRVVPMSPALGLTLPAQPARGTRSYANGAARPVDNVLTPKQVAELRKRLASDSRAVTAGVTDLVTLALATGARGGELVAVRWEDVRLDATPPALVLAGQMRRRRGHGLAWEPGLKGRTPGETRTIPLTADAVAMLRKRLDLRVEGKPGASMVFPSPRGVIPDPDNMNQQVRAAFDRAFFPWVTLHTIRRTVENRLMDSGTDPRVIEAVMGHTNRTALRAYWDRGINPARALDGLTG